jgi:hypothetical protein
LGLPLDFTDRRVMLLFFVTKMIIYTLLWCVWVLAIPHASFSSVLDNGTALSDIIQPSNTLQQHPCA